MTGVLDIGIVVLYLALMLAFGFFVFKENKSSAGFTRGGGKIPVWILGMSVFATYVSSISFLALPGNAFGGNWSNFVFSLSIPVAALVAVRLFVPWYRKINSDSAYAFLESKFGPWARSYASCCFLLTQIARMGAILYLLALPVNALTGVSVPLIIAVTGVLVMVYSSIGGLKAVVYTDAIQGFVLIAGALACLVYLVSGIDGHWQGLLESGMEQNKFSLGTSRFSWTENSFWLIFLYGVFINLQNFGADQSYIQRYIGAKSDREANKTVWIGGLLYLPVSFLFFMIGTALWVYYQQNPEALPAGLLPDQVFPHFIAHHLPVGLKGLLIAAILSAGMSTVSTSVNSSATILLTDFYLKRKPQASDGESLNFLRYSSAFMAITGICVGFLFMGVKSALDIWWALASIFSGGILGLVLLGIFLKTEKRAVAVWAIAAGVLFIVWVTVSPWVPGMRSYFQWHPNFVIIISTTLILLTGFLFNSLISGKRQK